MRLQRHMAGKTSLSVASPVRPYGIAVELDAVPSVLQRGSRTELIEVARDDAEEPQALQERHLLDLRPVPVRAG
jgi:hypothetical protein